jgi:hypothetical protein
LTHIKAGDTEASLPSNGSSFTGSMHKGLLRRLGIILLAIAFLGGGLAPIESSAAVLQSNAMSGLCQHDHAMHAGNAPATGHPDTNCPDPGGKAANCHCLACAVVGLAATHQFAVPLRWTRLAYQTTAARLSGEMPGPELLPPRSRS